MTTGRKRQVKIQVALCAIPLLIGCGARNLPSEPEVELIDPVGISANYDVAVLRDLYDYDLFSSVVSPYVTEYAFEKDHVFQKFGIAPGNVVSRGDTLIYSQTRQIDRQIADIDESIRDLESEHETEIAALQKDIQDAKEAEYKVHEQLASVYQFEPDIENQSAHTGWEKMAVGPEIAYKRAQLGRERLEQSLKESNEMYELKHQHLEGKRERLQREITDAAILAKEDGIVVNSAFVLGGENVAKDISLIAVGEASTKVLKTEYIAKNTIAKAEDVYAFINGKRYEVIHEPIEQEEYNRLSQEGETVYSTFYIQDPSDELSMGEYAVLVLVKESRTNVVCIPQDAVKTENSVSYCYVYDGENSTYTTVELGMKDGLYVEVLSGVKEGDKVLSTQGVVQKSHKETLKTGECGMDYDVNGFLYYPFSEWIENPVDEGTTYVKEILVSNYQPVRAGEVLMTLEVVLDEIEIARCQKRIERLTERLAELQKIKYDNDARKIVDRQNERAITANIAETERTKRNLEKLTKYGGIIEVKAPADGIITDTGWLKPGDMIYSDTKLMEFGSDSLRYLLVRDEKGALAYGNQAQIEYVDQSGERQTITGNVVTVDNKCVSKDLVKDWMLVSIPEENREAFQASTEGQSAWNRNSYTVKIRSRSMGQVVLVPKAAVTMVGGMTYVTVMEKDGTVQRHSFMSGGSNNDYYWVVSGLNEGMEICWE